MENLKIIAEALGWQLTRVGARYHIHRSNDAHLVAHNLEDVAFYLARSITLRGL
tara:strand:- start:292 stop:453 length:162 start_codon:yes stop_codon:yes gene_type:complete